MRKIYPRNDGWGLWEARGTLSDDTFFEIVGSEDMIFSRSRHSNAPCDDKGALAFRYSVAGYETDFGHDAASV
jgi:hypothetical protein